MVVIIKKIKGENVNYAGFDDVKKIYLIMVIIIRKEENQRGGECESCRDDAKKSLLDNNCQSQK